jgi:hypothetical protein
MGFVRFEWRDAFTKVTGVGQSTEILESEFTLAPKGASSHRIELRRCLQSWSNPPLRWSNTRDNDFNSNPVGAATWRDHAHPNRRWNKPGAQARTPGIDGTRTTDYDGVDDLAYAPAAVIPMASVKERLVVVGPGITDAIRFWFDNPSADYGFALQQAPGATAGTRFLGAEVQNNEFGPVLRITYRVTNTLGSLRAKK